GTDIGGGVAAGAALERRAADLAGEVDDHAVALLDLRTLPFRGIWPVLLGDPVERLADLRLGDLGDQALELDTLEVGKLDLGQDLERQRIGEIRLAADDLLDLGRLVGDRDLRLHGGLEAVVAHDLGVELADDGLDRLGHHRLAVDFLQVPDRNLARAEAAQLDLVLDLAQPLGDARFEVGGRHLDLEFALEAFGQGFGDFHG